MFSFPDKIDSSCAQLTHLPSLSLPSLSLSHTADSTHSKHLTYSEREQDNVTLSIVDKLFQWSACPFSTSCWQVSSQCFRQEQQHHQNIYSSTVQVCHSQVGSRFKDQVGSLTPTKRRGRGRAKCLLEKKKTWPTTWLHLHHVRIMLSAHTEAAFSQFDI